MNTSRVEGQEYPIDFPKVCDHCGKEELVFIGLVAPKCGNCSQFSLSHMTFVSNIGTGDEVWGGTIE